MKKFLKVLPLLVLLALVSVVGVAYADSQQCPAHPAVTLCHATPPHNAANGWNIMNIIAPAVFQQGHDGHDADIIPPFEWYETEVLHTYPGKNMSTLFGWGVTGAQILANGCVLPPDPFVPPDPITQTIYEVDCDGVMAQDQMAVWIGGPDGGYGDWENIGGPELVHVWTDPLYYEVWGEFTEPSECHDFSIKSHQAVDCEGYSRAINLYDFGVYKAHLLFDQGVFTYPYIIEPGLPAVSFAIPSEYGGGTVDFVALSEPAECQIFRTYKAHQAYLADNCEGIHRVINLYEGPASDPYATLVGTHYNETVLFSDPFALETIPAVTVDVPDAYGPDYTFAAMNEPETCYSTCDVTNPVVQDPVWGDWTPWVYNLGNGLEESTRIGTQTTLFMDSVGGEYVCGEEVKQLSEYRSREVEYSLIVVGIGDCFNWEYILSFTEGGAMSVVGDLKGSWTDIYGPEIAPVPTVSVVWPSDYSLTVTPGAIAKDNGCIQCRTTPYYPMAAYVDASAPEGYWQGPFGVGSGVCNVIHPEGQIPSVDRVTTLCSLCPDQYEGGYIYQVNHMFYDGWVYKIQCYGQEPHYMYMGYNWDEYVKIGEYTTEGVRLSCRVQGCADWIHENAH